MAAITGYEIVEPLGTVGGAPLVRALQQADGARVLLRLSQPRTSAQAARLRREYELLQSLDLHLVARPLALIAETPWLVMVLDDFDARPLPMPASPDRADLGARLQLSVHLAALLAGLHDAGLVHRGLRPSAVLVSTSSGQPRLVDCSLATRQAHVLAESAELPPDDEGLSHVSPEQTGRMNRAVDYRSDLYSLGVVLYRLFSAQLPFTAQGPLEWVHSHIARAPRALCDAVPDLPPMLGAIVMRLLAKEPEDRYQSARGLQHDLERCLAQWQSARQVLPFALGARDVSDRFRIPQKLYGREAELAALQTAFGAVNDSGTAQLALVSGPSGAGKSALVHALLNQVARSQGYFVSTKFDAHYRGVPYANWAAVLRQLVQQQLAQNEAQVAVWKAALHAALGAQLGLLTALAPELALIAGSQTPPDLPPEEAHNRFLFVVAAFVASCASREHPVLLLLDDLQWADAASLGLLVHLLTRTELRHLMLVVAHREPETDASPPWVGALSEIRKALAPLAISLGAFDAAALRQLLVDSLYCEPAAAQPLAELVLRKTGGNPFFVHQFLRNLHAEQLIKFDPRRGRWLWDLQAIEAAGVTDNVVDLMVAQIARLGPTTSQTLQLAACMGTCLELDTQAMLAGKPPSELAQALRPALEQGLLIGPPADLDAPVTLRWLHDRVQQAAYSMIPLAQRPRLHLVIGRTLRDRMPAEQQDARLFDIVEHLNAGAELIASEGERIVLAELNLRAGHAARRATAFASACTYYSAGLQLLPADPWRARYRLAFDLFHDLAECQTVCGDFEVAAQILQGLSDHARGLVDRAAAHRLQLRLHIRRGEDELGAGVALVAAHELFGIDLPLHPHAQQLRDAAERTWQQLARRPIEDLLQLPTITESAMKAAIELLSTALPAAYNIDPTLHDLLCCHIVDISLRHGNSESSPHGYVTFGAVLGRLFGRWEAARRLGEAARALVQRIEFAGGRTSVYYTIAQFIDFWVRPFRETLALFEQAFQSAQDGGDINYACFTAVTVVECHWAMGQPLDAVAAQVQSMLDFTRRAKSLPAQDRLQGVYRLSRALQGMTSGLSVLDTPQSSEAEFEARVAGDASPSRRSFYFHSCKAWARLLAEDYAGAFAAVEAAGPSQSVAIGKMGEFDYCCITALALAAHCSDGAMPPEHLRRLIACRDKLAEWQTHCAENFRDRYLLVCAELARVQHQPLEAMRLYDEAIGQARANGLVHNEALACEFAARNHRFGGFALIAGAYLQAARACYVRWGASGKVSHLDRHHPGLRSAPVGSAVVVGVEQMDLLSVVKASHALSGEIILERLLETLMRVALESAGAQRGFLLLVRGEGVVLAAKASTDGLQVQIQQGQALSASDLPVTILNYVRRSRDKVLLDDATSPNLFSADEYLLRQPTKSVLCLPVLRQTELAALLYLDNSLVSCAFTPDRLNVLELLASQAAISLANATLYADLQKENSERRRAQEAVRDSQQQLQSIIDNSTAVIYLKDLEGRYLLINHRFEELHHVARETVVGKTDYDLFPKERADAFRAFDQQVLATGQPRRPRNWYRSTTVCTLSFQSSARSATRPAERMPFAASPPTSPSSSRPRWN